MSDEKGMIKFFEKNHEIKKPINWDKWKSRFDNFMYYFGQASLILAGIGYLIMIIERATR